MLTYHRLLFVWALAAVCSSCQSAPPGSPAFVLTDPIEGGPVPVSCAGVDVRVCDVAAGAMLDYLTPDSAAVEAIRVEPLADPPVGATFAVRVTLDHRMFLNPGVQPYRVVQLPEDAIQISAILD